MGSQGYHGMNSAAYDLTDDDRKHAEESLRRLSAEMIDMLEYCYGGLPNGRQEISVARIKLGELVFWTSSALHNIKRIEPDNDGV